MRWDEQSSSSRYANQPEREIAMTHLSDVFSAALIGERATRGRLRQGAAGLRAAAPDVTVAAVEERKVTEWDEFIGRLEAVESVEVRPRVSGYIERVVFTAGKEVRKGDLLFQIDPRPYQAELARAEAELAQARSAAALAARESGAVASRWSPATRSRARSSTTAPPPPSAAQPAVQAAAGRRRDRAPQSRVDPRALADQRPRRPGRGHRRQPGAGRRAPRG